MLSDDGFFITEYIVIEIYEAIPCIQSTKSAFVSDCVNGVCQNMKDAKSKLLEEEANVIKTRDYSGVMQLLSNVCK